MSHMSEKLNSRGYKPGKIYLLGEKYSGVRSRGGLQIYDQLKKFHLQQGSLFEDPQFFPGSVELGLRKEENVQWLRPREIVPSPHFVLHGKEKCDINQGELGDCWFLAALVNITQDQDLIDLIVPPGQSFFEDYAGIFHFRFWHNGKWIEVVIDDKLPTLHGKLIFMQQLPNHDEFWAALTEKAYAKLHGSYQNIQGGLISEALVEMTGGLNETYFNLARDSKKINFFDIMQTSLRKKSSMGCGIVVNETGARRDGLISKHAYSITGLQEFEIYGVNKQLLRLRNPWGHHEWNGTWSDHSDVWNTVPKNIREKLLSIKDDGEFWMEYRDFLKIFDYLDICHKNPDFFRTEDSARWKTFMTNCAWVAGVNNGGSAKSAAFSMNPQFFLTINGPRSNERFRIITAVLQKDRRERGLNSLPIGFAIYELIDKSVRGRLTSSAFREELCLYFCNPEQQSQVTGHIDLPNGVYCLIPFTTEIKENCDFLLRVYAEIDFDLGERDDNVNLIDKLQNPQMFIARKESDGRRETNSLEKLFAGHHKAEIGWRELKSIMDQLVKSEGREFSKELCRSMISLADTNITGKLNIDEFKLLWKSICIWRGIYTIFDPDNSRGIRANELRQALKEANIKVNNRILQILLLRFANEKGQMELEDFLLCCIKLNHTIALYEVKGIKELTLMEWLIATLYS